MNPIQTPRHPSISFPSNYGRIAVLVVLLSFISGFFALHAQNTNTTDTAPVAQTPAPATGPSLLPNGDFSAGAPDAKMPDGWTWDPAAPITWETESGKHFVRLVSQQPGQTVQLVRTVPIPPDANGLVLSYKFRVANFQFGTSYARDMKFCWRFLDGQGKGMSGDGAVLDSHTKVWTELNKHVLAPKGAVQVEVKFIIDGAGAGTLDAQEIGVAAMDPAEAARLLAAAQAVAAKKAADDAAAEKKKNDDMAVVQQILALPPITPEIKVSGNKLVTADGKTVWLQGVNVPSLEWSDKGENILQSFKVAIDDWKANVIRLPLNNSYWFGRGKTADITNTQPVNEQAAAAYRQVVDNAVKMAAARGAYIVLDLHRFGAPDAFAVEFWKDVAARYKDNPAVLFDIFNEPTGTTWEVWQKGGDVGTGAKTYKSPGMQGLVDAVRGTGAKNIIVAGGLSYAYDLTGILNGFALEDKTGNGIMYATHFYNWHTGWQKYFLDLADKYPIFIGETGADVHKMSFIPAQNQEDPYTWVPDMLGLVQKYHLNWTAWSFHTAATPDLLSNWAYEPTPYFGAFVKDALAGKQFEMKKMR